MKYFIVTTDDECSRLLIRNAFFIAKDDDIFINYTEVSEIPETQLRADGSPRMTFAQREKLWQLCGGYNVPFREDDYVPVEHGGKIFYEGWIGVRKHNGVWGESKSTIFVGVEPDGRSHS